MSSHAASTGLSGARATWTCLTKTSRSGCTASITVTVRPSASDACTDQTFAPSPGP